MRHAKKALYVIKTLIDKTARHHLNFAFSIQMMTRNRSALPMKIRSISQKCAENQNNRLALF